MTSLTVIKSGATVIFTKCWCSTRGLRGHQGPLVDAPPDHICRLIDFYIEQKHQALVASNGKNKDVLLWLLLRHISRAQVSPADMHIHDVLAFVADCYELPSEHLNLINDDLPKLKTRTDLPPSLLPLSVLQQVAGPPPQAKRDEQQNLSTAWANVAKQVCSGQAAAVRADVFFVRAPSACVFRRSVSRLYACLTKLYFVC